MRRRKTLAPIDAPRQRAAEGSASSGLAVVGQDDVAGVLLDPTRRRILAALQLPGSATSVAEELAMSRQLVNYHIRTLEGAGLVEEVDRRQRRGLEERIVRATAAYYLISPAALGALGESPTSVADSFSATYQVAVAARTITEVAALATLARDAGKRLTTLTIDTEVRLATPAAREAFASELLDAVNRLAARYHDERAADGRTYRVFAGAHPVFRGSHHDDPQASPPPEATGRKRRDRRTGRSQR